MTIAIVSSPRDTKNKVIQGRIETGAKHKRTNDQTSKNLSSISYTNKELGVGGIHMKQKHDFYLSNLGRDLCIRYLREKKKNKDTKIQSPKQSIYIIVDLVKQANGPLCPHQSANQYLEKRLKMRVKKCKNEKENATVVIPGKLP